MMAVCSTCRGNGENPCGMCGATGRHFNEVCRYCRGNGAVTCGGCGGTGQER
jgi:hypothetical protein